MKTISKQLSVLVFGLVASTTCGCKDTAEVVAEKTVKVAKDTTKGLAEGIDKGRKAGESSDGAVLVSSPEDLRGKGLVSVYAVRGSDVGASSDVDLVIENLGDRPLRLVNLDFEGFDKEGFVKHPRSKQSEVTVPAHAKEKLTLTFNERAASLAKVRYWRVDLDLSGVKAR